MDKPQSAIIRYVPGSIGVRTDQSQPFGVQTEQAAAVQNIGAKEQIERSQIGANFQIKTPVGSASLSTTGVVGTAPDGTPVIERVGARATGFGGHVAIGMERGNEAGRLDISSKTDKEGNRVTSISFDNGIDKKTIEFGSQKPIIQLPAPPAPTPVREEPVFPIGSSNYCVLIFSRYGYLREYYEGRYWEGFSEVEGATYTFDSTYPKLFWGSGTISNWKFRDRWVPLGGTAGDWKLADPARGDIGGGYRIPRGGEYALPSGRTVGIAGGILDGYSNDSSGARTNVIKVSGRESDIYDYIRLVSIPRGELLDSGYTWWTPAYAKSTYTLIAGSCDPGAGPVYSPLTPNPTLPPRPVTPNPPPSTKLMNCCDKVERIFKILAVEKFEKSKFKFSEYFAIPTSTKDKEVKIGDYYELFEWLIKMLANGLIISPETKPHGVDFKVTNATSWAEQIYNMTAEQSGDGESTQKYEVCSAYQSAQMWAKIAEMDTKLDFLMNAIAEFIKVEAKPTPIEIPCAFNIFEVEAQQKGFDPNKKPSKQPIDSDVTGKTNDEIERILAQILQPSKIPILKWEYTQQFNPSKINLESL